MEETNLKWAKWNIEELLSEKTTVKLPVLTIRWDCSVNLVNEIDDKKVFFDCTTVIIKWFMVDENITRKGNSATYRVVQG